MSESPVNRIAVFTSWRRGSAAAAVVCGVALALGWLHSSTGVLVGLAVALLIGVEAHFALRRLVVRCVLLSQAVGVPAVTRCRQRLCSMERRYALAAAARQLAGASGAGRRSEFVLWDRVALVRSQLLALADGLESVDDVDPRTMLELHRLLSDGRDSPLLNPERPTAELLVTLRCLLFRLATAAH
jgi:hypothetical protein